MAALGAFVLGSPAGVRILGSYAVYAIVRGVTSV
jgi:hypothetical protein